ncbi:innexin inx2-like [Coccinella septempunctata]|uniref:innexin inx2-like n=1 Tax=Coccinella septempunctata TaxID=41139 RepID=UPI001D06AD47|nr:innexin inx2-like [Coccinella septempunctata]
MIDLLNSFKSLIKYEQVNIDNNVFKLHYRFTVVLLVIFSALLTSKEYFGEPISCDTDDQDRKQLIDMFCWIHGTYIINKGRKSDILPGIFNIYDSTFNDLKNHTKKIMGELTLEKNDQIIWQKYYQWVCIIFGLQALLFYLPRYIWKHWEGGRMELLVQDLCGPLVPPEWNQATREKLLDYLMNNNNGHTLYALHYSFCEGLNLVNVVLQIKLMDWFLAGQFSLYGLTFASVNNLSPMDRVFPKLAKCMYYRFGPSSTIENRDALCVLPLNILNEKLFLIIWIWFHVLAFITAMFMVYRCLVICIPSLRSYILISHSRHVWCFKVKLMIMKINYGDFFVLDHLGKNLNPVIFCDIINDIHHNLQAKEKCKNLVEDII